MGSLKQLLDCHWTNSRDNPWIDWLTPIRKRFIIWRCPESWGYPQSSSISPFLDGVFHEINQPFWIPRFVETPISTNEKKYVSDYPSTVSPGPGISHPAHSQDRETSRNHRTIGSRVAESPRQNTWPKRSPASLEDGECQGSLRGSVTVPQRDRMIWKSWKNTGDKSWKNGGFLKYGYPKSSICLFLDGMVSRKKNIPNGFSPPL